MLHHASIEIAIRNVWPVADPSVKRAEESAAQAVERAEGDDAAPGYDDQRGARNVESGRGDRKSRTRRWVRSGQSAGPAAAPRTRPRSQLWDPLRLWPPGSACRGASWPRPSTPGCGRPSASATSSTPTPSRAKNAARCAGPARPTARACATCSAPPGTPNWASGPHHRTCADRATTAAHRPGAAVAQSPTARLSGCSAGTRRCCGG